MIGWISRTVRAGLILACACSSLSLVAPASAQTTHVYRYWATVDNPYPVAGSRPRIGVTGYFTVDTKPVAKVRMATVWRDGRSQRFCYGTTNNSGLAYCARRPAGLRLGSSVQISVIFYYQKATYSTAVSVLPQ